MLKELHLWLDRDGHTDEDIAETVVQTILHRNHSMDGIVHTVIPHYLSFDYAKKLFVHYQGRVHEITLGVCEGTDKYIRKEHNIEKLLFAGHFDWF